MGGLLWLAVVLYGAALGAMHWKALTHNVWDQVFSAGNVLAMALVYPLVKAVHELGHACAVKARGGEVHEIGLMFLLLVPIPMWTRRRRPASPTSAGACWWGRRASWWSCSWRRWP